MKPFDKNNLADSLLIHEEMYSRYQHMYNMQNQLPMGYPPGFVTIGDRVHLQSQDIGAVKFADKLNDSESSGELIYYIHKDDNQNDKIGYTADIIEATDAGNLIISKERLDEILLQFCILKNSDYSYLEHALNVYKSKNIYIYDSLEYFIHRYNKCNINLHQLNEQFQQFETIVPELENFVKYTNEVSVISREMDNRPKKLLDIKTIISSFKIKISPAAYEILKSEYSIQYSRRRICICNIKDDEYSIHIDNYYVYYSKLVALLNLPWKTNSNNIKSKRKLIELLKSDQYDELVIPVDLIQSVVCILQDRAKI